MKRRISTASNAKRRRNEAGKVSHTQTNYSGPPFSDLPSDIMVNLLLRLPIKTILVCKCVCKTWYDLISDPEFTELHFAQAQVHALIRTSGFTFLSRMLYLVQPEQDDFEHKLYMRYDTSPIKIKLDSKLKLPLRNLQMLNPDSGAERNNCMKLNMKDHKYRIVNSCNGLLCLSNPSDDDPVIVCNPVTGEFVNLPEARTVKHPNLPYISGSGFGFSPTTNQYKVIRMFPYCGQNKSVMVPEVHILGTDSWKDLPLFPKSLNKLVPTYLNGYLYWFSLEEPCSVISFDIEKECFRCIRSPPFKDFNLVREASMGVLGEELFISEVFGSGDVRFWAMKDNGAKKAWSEIFRFNLGESWPYGSYQPIKYMTNGALLMFHSHKHAFIYKDPNETGFRYLKVRGMESKVEAIAHVPSLVSLKHALSGHNVEVLHVKSRCAGFKLHKETKGISIVEKKH